MSLGYQQICLKVPQHSQVLASSCPYACFLLSCFYLLPYIWFINFVYMHIYFFIFSIYFFSIFICLFFLFFFSFLYLIFIYLFVLLLFTTWIYYKIFIVMELKFSTWVSVLGFVLKVSVYCVKSKSIVAVIDWAFLQWQ